MFYTNPKKWSKINTKKISEQISVDSIRSYSLFKWFRNEYLEIFRKNIEYYNNVLDNVYVYVYIYIYIYICNLFYLYQPFILFVLSFIMVLY